MTSHIRRLQHQQQRQALYGRLDDSFSLSRNNEDSLIDSERSIHRTGHGSSLLLESSILPYQNNMAPTMQYANFSTISKPFSSSIRSPSIISGSASYLKSGNNANGSVLSFQSSRRPLRSISSHQILYGRGSIYRSRSLGASKASLATIQSGRSTIQAEHHDRKIQLRLNAVDFGRAQKPYLWAVLFFVLFAVTLFVGLVILCLRHVYMSLVLSVNVGESIGPLLCAGSFIFFGAGMKFLYDAYQLGAKERQKIKYRAASASTVTVKLMSSKPQDPTEELSSGKTTAKALSRAPLGTPSYQRAPM